MKFSQQYNVKSAIKYKYGMLRMNINLNIKKIFDLNLSATAHVNHSIILVLIITYLNFAGILKY